MKDQIIFRFLELKIGKIIKFKNYYLLKESLSFYILYKIIDIREYI